MGNVCAAEADGKPSRCCCVNEADGKQSRWQAGNLVSMPEPQGLDQSDNLYGASILLSKEQLARDTDRERPQSDYDENEQRLSEGGGEAQAQPAAVLGGSISGLRITFKTTEGVVKDVIFTHRPLGLDFEMVAPIVIRKVLTGSWGEELGIQPGWTITGVNGESVGDSDFKVKYKMLRKETVKLPDTRPDPSPRDGS